ncbi:MAG: TolC family outer membrane protein [Alphaproteobacteria bacterium]
MSRLGSKLTGLVAGFAILAGIGVADATAASLQESVSKAVATHPRIGALKSNRDAIDHELRQARGLYLPQVDLRAAVGPEWSDSPGTRARDTNSTWDTRKESSIILQQRIFDGFEADSEVAQQKARSKSASYRVSESAQFTGLDAVEAHIEVLRFRKLIEAAERNVEIHRSYLGRVRERTESGAGTTDESAQAQSRLDAAEAILTDNIKGLRDAEAKYINIVGDAPTELDDVPLPLAALPADIDNALLLLAKNPTVKITDADIETTEALIGLAESRFYPHINLELSGRWDDDLDGIEGRDRDAIALVVLRWNLYRGGIDTANRNEAVERRAEARNNRLVAVRNFEEEMRNSWAQFEAESRRSELLASAVEQNVIFRDAYSEQFDLGTRSLLDLLDAENELYSNTSQQLTAEYARRFAAYRILAVGGELLQMLNVAQPEQATPHPADEGFDVFGSSMM